ncbi:recombinase family protein [Agrobacterium tumefaciens]|nr:recombinase family protein [Agrobacterium tumefaciens]
MGAIIGYARVSTSQQDYSLQVGKLEVAGAVKIFREKRSGLDGERPALAECLRYLREGDTLLVTKLDRLARSTSDLYRIVSNLEQQGVAFRVLDDAAIDTSSRTGKLVMGILALIAEFETDIRKERQMEGIAKAKAEGRSGGRPAQVTGDVRKQVIALRHQGVSIRRVADTIGYSKATVQKIIAAENKDSST